MSLVIIGLIGGVVGLLAVLGFFLAIDLTTLLWMGLVAVLIIFLIKSVGAKPASIMMTSKVMILFAIVAVFLFVGASLFPQFVPASLGGGSLPLAGPSFYLDEKVDTPSEAYKSDAYSECASILLERDMFYTYSERCTFKRHSHSGKEIFKVTAQETDGFRNLKFYQAIRDVEDNWAHQKLLSERTGICPENPDSYVNKFGVGACASDFIDDDFNSDDGVGSDDDVVDGSGEGFFGSLWSRWSRFVGGVNV